MTSKFKVGDAVMISTSSEYYTVGNCTNPKDTKGRVIGVEGEDGSLPYLVDWDNDTTNTYEASDLIKVEEVKEKHIHDILVDRSTLEVGDIVTVTHKVPSSDLGWYNCWLSGMDRAIGKECEVTSAPDSKGISLGGLGEGFGFPLQSVQLVRKGPKKINVHISEDYIAVVTEEGIKINDQVITFEDFDDLVKAVAKMRK
jgi:hypothetical protein